MVAASLLRRFAWRGQAGLGAAAMRVAAVLVVLLGVTASAWIARAWDATVTRQRDERLDHGAASRTTTLVSALRQYETALHAGRSLWLASTFVSRQEFSVFADSLNLRERYPGLQGIGWRSFVPDQQARDFVARVRKDGPPDFTIRPAGRRPVYYVTLYNEPARLFGATWGLDARATPSVLAALEQARDTGKTVMSGQTTLWPDLASQAERPVAYELFVPVYGDGEPIDTTAQRRAAHMGWASGIFNASDFLQAALRSTQPSTGVELYDPAAGSAAPIATFPGGGFRAGGPHLRTDSFTFGGRTFGLRYTPLPGNPTLTERTIPAPLVVTTGIAVSLLLGALLWLLAQVSTLYQRVGRMARTDPLTGVLNRRVWDQELPRELARAARSGQPLCANLRTTDLLVRYGGEELAALLPDCGLDHAMAIAGRLRGRVNQRPGAIAGLSLGVRRDPGAGGTLSLEADREAGPRNLLGVLLDAYWTSLADDPLSALLFTALMSLGGVLLVLLVHIAVYLFGQLVAVLP
jgi:CHASE1-domain containing sensor protein